MDTGITPPMVAPRAPTPRRWAAIRPLADPHIANSVEAILRASEEVAPGRAIVLGAGRCREIPLAGLTHRFGGVTLVDSDESALDHAVQAADLPADRPGSVRRLVADLTGATGLLLGRVDRALGDARSPDEALGRLAALAEEVCPLPFAPGPRYDLVVASCVLSQLHLGALRGTIARFVARYPAHEATLTGSPRWFEAASTMARRMERAFVGGLADLVTPGGLVYLSESVRACFLHGTTGGGWASDGWYTMTGTGRLADEVDGRFVVRREGRWPWVVRPPAGPGRVGKLFQVQAMVLSGSAVRVST